MLLASSFPAWTSWPILPARDLKGNSINLSLLVIICRAFLLNSQYWLSFWSFEDIICFRYSLRPNIERKSSAKNENPDVISFLNFTMNSEIDYRSHMEFKNGTHMPFNSTHHSHISHYQMFSNIMFDLRYKWSVKNVGMVCAVNSWKVVRKVFCVSLKLDSHSSH